jgi:hypothetical protein
MTRREHVALAGNGEQKGMQSNARSLLHSGNGKGNGKGKKAFATAARHERKMAAAVEQKSVRPEEVIPMDDNDLKEF